MEISTKGEFMIREKQQNFLRKVVKEILKNAEQFVNDAEILFKRKSYGHAFALAVLGEEELVKAIMYSLAVDGIIGIKGKWRRGLRKHKWKQIIASSVAMMYELILMLEEAWDFAEKKSKGNTQRFKEIFEKKAVEIIQEEKKLAARRRGELFEHIEPFEELQRKREKAMYVDANLKELKINSPRKFKKAKAKRYISHAKERLETVKHEIGKRSSATDREVARSFIKMVLDRAEGEQKKKLLEWYGIWERDLGV